MTKHTRLTGAALPTSSIAASLLTWLNGKT